MDYSQLIPVAALGGYLLYRWLEQRHQQQAPSLDATADVQIVVTLAARLAHDRGADRIGIADFVMASLEDPRIGASLARAGLEPERARASLAVMAASEAAPRPLPHDDEVPPVAHDNPPLQTMSWTPELAEAFALARTRPGPELALAHVLEAIRDRLDGEVSRMLRASAVSFDDTLVATIVGEPEGGHVYLWNDAISTMDAVAQLLCTVFAQREHQALYTMLCVHHRGWAALGPYPPARAAELVAEATARAREQGMPHLRVELSAPDTSDWRMREAGGFLP
jgi:ATP-dependent Clp protease adapter protein ClpS